MNSLIEEGSTNIEALSNRKKLPRHRRERPLMQAPHDPVPRKKRAADDAETCTHTEIRCPLQLASELLN